MSKKDKILKESEVQYENEWKHPWAELCDDKWDVYLSKKYKKELEENTEFNHSWDELFDDKWDKYFEKKNGKL